MNQLDKPDWYMKQIVRVSLSPANTLRKQYSLTLLALGGGGLLENPLCNTLNKFVLGRSIGMKSFNFSLNLFSHMTQLYMFAVISY